MSKDRQSLPRGGALVESPQPGNLVTLKPAMAELASSIDRVASSYAQSIQAASGHIERSFLLSEGLIALRQAITPRAMEVILPLMNCELGFKTDRPSKNKPTPYSPEEVKECLISALLRGLYPIGNEWNIIAGQCFTALNGWKREFEEVPGISDIRCVPGLPRNSDGGMVVRVALSWKLNGVADHLTNEKGEPGMSFAVGVGGTDALIGKARRRAYKAAWEKVTGSATTEPDEVEAVETPAQLPEPTRTQQVAGRLRQASNGDTAARCQALLTQLEVGLDEFHEICEQLQIPGDLAQMSPPQRQQLLNHLETMKAQVDAETAAERESVRQQG